MPRSSPHLASASNLKTTVSFHLARAIGRASSLWGRKGLGTLYAQLGRLPLVSSDLCDVEVCAGARFLTEPFEPYWAPTVIGGRPYEPELLHVLRRLSSHDPVFVDCGANYGYWSVLATSPRLAFTRVMAIEANPATVKRLRLNWEANQRRFQVVERAVSSESGKSVQLAQAEHHAVACIASAPGGSGPTVETITIDDALSRARWDDASPVLLKLDVEGHEIAALEGAEGVRARDYACVFEDFVEKKLETVEYMLRAETKVYYVDRRGRCRSIPTLDSAYLAVGDDHKLRLSCNFVACRPGGALNRVFALWSQEVAWGS